MRICLVLSLLAALFVAGCGGEEMAPADGSGDGKAAKAPDAGDENAPPAKKRRSLSQDATTVKLEYDSIKKMQDLTTKMKKAAEKAKENAYRADDAQFYVGQLYQLAQDPVGAAKAFERFADTCPDSVNHKTALYYAGKACVESGDPAKAEEFLNKIVAKYSARTDLINGLGNLLGEAFANAGDYDKAVTYLKKAADGGSVMASLQLIQLNWIRADFDGARAAATKFVETSAGAKPKEKERAAVYKAIADRCGKPAKAFDVEGWADNADFNAADYKGKVYVVYMWKMPAWSNARLATTVMAFLHKTYGGKGLKIVGLNKPYGLDPEDRNAGSGRDLSTDAELRAISVWAAQEDFGVKWPLGLCRGDSDHEFYGWWGGSIPAVALVDKKGRLRFVQHGVGTFGDPDPIKLFQAAVQKCLAE